jgi:long-chain acyl-CoA synthetase
MRDERVSVLLGVPTMCVALLRAAEGLSDPPQLRVAHIGGAALAPETLHAFAARFGCTMLEGYGMTELSGTVTAHRPGRPIKPGSVGIPVDGVEVRVVDREGSELPAGEIGEVLARGSGQMRGYWRNETDTKAAFVADGWLATEDMGVLDEDGYLTLVDRKKDIILRGGYTVYPREVEDVLHEHPAVLEAVIVGVPHELLGEEVVALVVPRRGIELAPDDVRAFLRERVAAYKYPRLVVVVDDLPRGPTGKILKRAIDRAPLQHALDAQHATR